MSRLALGLILFAHVACTSAQTLDAFEGLKSEYRAADTIEFIVENNSAGTAVFLDSPGDAE